MVLRYAENLKMTESIDHVSLREMRRLTWVDTFCGCIKPPFHRGCFIHNLTQLLRDVYKIEAS